ncbi:hypothetical protein GH714_026598 [Hevea brasiliensis]|uniref:Protease inhibitor n=2 Tax=Hevea brasiliensis TaxID=3981 RepID=A0A6A6NJE3_HEVBR|nr:hypothetical protein GH714_026598 [Hevea brasiliensis]
MASQCPVKDAWPELIGTNGDIAAGIIETENANVKAIVLKKGSPMTMEYNLCRVLVFVDDNRVVHIMKPSVVSRSLEGKKASIDDSVVSVPSERNPVPPSSASPCTYINGGSSHGGHC